MRVLPHFTGVRVAPRAGEGGSPIVVGSAVPVIVVSRLSLR